MYHDTYHYIEEEKYKKNTIVYYKLQTLNKIYFRNMNLMMLCYTSMFVSSQ